MRNALIFVALAATLCACGPQRRTVPTRGGSGGGGGGRVDAGEVEDEAPDAGTVDECDERPDAPVREWCGWCEDLTATPGEQVRWNRCSPWRIDDGSEVCTRFDGIPVRCVACCNDDTATYRP